MSDFEVKSYLGDYPFFDEDESISFPIEIDGVIYEEEDAHIFVANGNEVRLPIPSGTLPILVTVNEVNVTPTSFATRTIEVEEIGEDGEITTTTEEVEVAAITANDGDTIHAIFDWNNSNEIKQTWFSDITQFGSRSDGDEPEGYENPPALSSGRIPGQLKEGTNAFNAMQASPEIISNLDVSNLTDMGNMFRESFFNQDISGWDTSNVTDMASMFYNATTFNSDISKWDTSKVTDMAWMFYYASFFNSDISPWDTSKVTDMGWMFSFAIRFNQDLSEWCVSQFAEMPQNFDYKANYWTLENSRPVWGTCPRGENLPDLLEPLGYELEDCHIFIANENEVNILSAGGVEFVAVDGVPMNYETDVKNKAFPGSTIYAIYDWVGLKVNWFEDILQFGSRSVWDDSQSEYYKEPEGYVNPPALPSGRIPNQLKSGEAAFGGNSITTMVANPVLISKLDVSNLTTMNSMFGRAPNFNQDLSGWDTSNVTDMYGMFVETPFNQDISKWDTSKVTDMDWMFGKSSFDQDLSQWCVSLIKTKPSSFDYNAAFEGQTAMQPQWGECPGGEDKP